MPSDNNEKKPILGFYNPSPQDITPTPNESPTEAAKARAIDTAMTRLKATFKNARHDEALWTEVRHLLTHPPVTSKDPHGRDVVTSVEAKHHRTKAFNLAGKLADSEIMGEGRNSLTDKLAHWLASPPNLANVNSISLIATSYTRWLDDAPIKPKGKSR
jgi:hypothetical protein